MVVWALIILGGGGGGGGVQHLYGPPHCPERSEIVLVGILVPCHRFSAQLLGCTGGRRGGGGGRGGGHLPPGLPVTVEPALLPEA